MRTTKDKPISPQQMKALHATFRSKGFDEEERHDFISRFTEGRVSSTKELTFNEARLMLERLNESDKKKKEREQMEAKNLLKAIFFLSFEISFLNKGFSNDTEEEFEMNKAKLNVFSRDRSASHKNLTEMNLNELKAFKKQLEAIAYNENNKSKNKKS
ncbi:hypothetical protein [Bacteroides congonensis]